MNHRGKMRAGIAAVLLMAMVLSTGCVPRRTSASDPGKVNIRDYTYSWMPKGYKDGSQLRIQTGYYGMNWDISDFKMQLRNLGVISEELSQKEAGHFDNTLTQELPAVSDSTWSVNGKPASVYASVQLNQDTSAEMGKSSSSQILRLINSGTFMQYLEVPLVQFEQQAHIRGWMRLAATPRYMALNLRLTGPDAPLDREEMAYALTLDAAFSRITKAENGAVTLRDSKGNGFSFSIISGDSRMELSAEAEGTTVTVRAANISTEKAGDYASATLIITPVSPALPEKTLLASDCENNFHVAYTPYAADGKPMPEMQALFDADRAMYCVPLGHSAYDAQNPQSHNALNRVRFTVANESNQNAVIPVVFDGDGQASASITGGCPMLRDAKTGEPTGIPVQISKNWHDRITGQWYMLYTMVEVPAKSTAELEFTMTNTKWGQAYAVHHSQLSLIGWSNVNWLWDESGLGSFGESITYDKDMCLGRAMVDDVRPFLVLGKSGRQWNWSGNVGGADFLVYNRDGTRYKLVGVKNSYEYYGPNLTKVLYEGQTADGAIDAEITMQLGRTDDVVRAYYTMEYQFNQDVKYDRLALFQAGADGYADNSFRNFAYSLDGTNVTADSPVEGRKKGYRDENLRWKEGTDNMWLYQYDSSVLPEENGNVLSIVRDYEANINGKKYTNPYFSIYYSGNGRKILPAFELSLPYTDGQLVKAGSTVRAVVEYVITPAHDYYGDCDYILEMGDRINTTDMAVKQAVGNIQKLDMEKGTLVRQYPNVIRADKDSAQFTLTGGLGYVPVTFTGLTGYSGYTLQYLDGEQWKPLDQSSAAEFPDSAALAGQTNDFWQCNRNCADGTYELTYNIENQGPVTYRLIRK